jgi:ATP-dependent RNA circularization protein (DNA/RNA ligase family)
MIPYIKIDTPFERDNDGTKKLIDGKFRNETVEYLKDNKWLCSEKIDGTNIGVVWDGHKVSFQGRTERAQIPTQLVNKLNELFGGTINEEMFEQKFGEMNVILFGEGYGPKIQKGGGLYRDNVSFILFDVYLSDQNLWLKRDAVEDIAKSFGIDVVDIVLTGTLQEAIDFVKTKPKSHIGTANMEGLVCRPTVELLDRMGRRVITKIKVCDFAE